ncbi:serine/threonine-protein kinase 31 [Nematostella vectensis]|uniref:serine/threonine-protein kinase 31 n=1 Tax=Nematostella vectensis TaxID=45351 RepID=UPI002077322F|nr:serine/threonine-protein kinase 31 [Nematostella vectensis]
MNGVARQPRGPLFNAEAERNGESTATWSNSRRRFSSESGDFYREDGPDFSYSEYSLSLNNSSHQDEQNIFITHVESPTTFWAQAADPKTVEAIEKLTVELQMYCANKPVLQNRPLIKKIYGGIYSSDGSWYRCIVVKRDSGPKIPVRFIDFGNTEEITKQNMVCLSLSLINQPPYAQRYSLDGLGEPQPSSSQYAQAMEYMTNLAVGKMLSVTAKRQRTSMIDAVPVEMIDKEAGLNINTDMKSKGLALHALPGSGRVSPSLPKTPISPVIKQVPSSPLSTSSPVIRELENNAELQRLRDIVQDQQNQIRSQRQLNFQQKEKHREELTKLQQSKMHALNTKFETLMSSVNEVRNLRHKSAKFTSEEIFGAVNVLNEMAGLAVLSKVKATEECLEQKQNAIRACTDKELLQSLVEERNTSRTDLLADIEELCTNLSTERLEEWMTNLQAAHKSLQTVAESVDCPLPTLDESLSYSDVIKEYEEWTEICKLDLEEVRSRCDKEHQHFNATYADLMKLIEFVDPDDKVIEVDLDSVMEKFVSVMNEEISVTKRTGEDKAKHLKSKVLAALLGQLSKEIEEDRLRHDLDHFKSLKAHIHEAISSTPDVQKVIATKKTIRSLKSKIGHKLIDREDLRERDDAEEEEITQCEEELSEAYLKLHAAFDEEQKLVAELANLSCVHFPELPLNHPELDLKTWLATQGLVVSGRTLDHYPVDSKAASTPSTGCHVMETQFAGQRCYIKEYQMLDVASKELFERQAIEYHNVQSFNVAKLHSLFYAKQAFTAYLHIQHYVTLAGWLETEPSKEHVVSVVHGFLEGLESLHKAGLVHGGLTEHSVLVDTAATPPIGVIGHFDFSKPLSNRISDTSSSLGLTVRSEDAAFDKMCLTKIFNQSYIDKMCLTKIFNQSYIDKEDPDIKTMMNSLV